MKTLLALAVLVTGSATVVVPAQAEQASGAASSPRVCVLFEQQRSGSRRICLTPSQWQARLGPDWRSFLTGRTVDDDLALLGTLTRNRSEPLLRDGCFTCREVPPPSED